MIRTSRALGILGTLLFFGGMTAPGVAGDLLITVRDIQSDSGRVYVAVHAPRKDVKFPEAAGMISGGWWLARAGELSIMFRDLPTGQYAVNAFHDANGNGDLDTNIIGMPIEGYGFGNGATGIVGPPGFDEASVLVGTRPVEVTIPLAY